MEVNAAEVAQRKAEKQQAQVRKAQELKKKKAAKEETKLAKQVAQQIQISLKEQAKGRRTKTPPILIQKKVIMVEDFTTKEEVVEIGNGSDPRCVVTIDLDGHSQRDQFVFVPYDQVRVMAQRIVDFCVGIFDRGGFMTYGVGRTLEALITPTAYSGGNTDIPTPAYVEQPDESVGLGIVAVPSNQDTGAAYILAVCPVHSNYIDSFTDVPYYMVISVSGPRVELDPENTDYSISSVAIAEIQDMFLSSKTSTVQNRLARVLEGLQGGRHVLRRPNHPRWWVYPIEPLTPVPNNVIYGCDASLGSPSLANCEAALYQFVQSGDVSLDPASGPVIKISGNCAIAVGANEKHSTTWDILRSVAETLVQTCISSPVSGTLGGTAISQSIVGWKRSSLYQRLTRSSKVDFPPTFEIAVYLQQPFNGAADATCSWGVVASHQGDVRDCPARAAPVRPPERRLGANLTLIGKFTSAGSFTTSANVTTNSSAMMTVENDHT
ncbi:MAG: hypothetical protein ASARMPREDX12_006046 [Alectoria sarmentosa]|nr:MAG: hypothetical protein ASARMPREDX12_006046 [Alectoria sarmentosa]